MTQRQINHKISLVFALVVTIIDSLNSHVSSSLLVSIEAFIFAMIIYYLIARASIVVVLFITKMFKF